MAGLDRNREDTAIVHGVIGPAHAMNPTAVAEGVDTRDQAEAPTKLGCQLAQRYFWAKPIDPGDLADLLTVSQGALEMSTERGRPRPGDHDHAALRS